MGIIIRQSIKGTLFNYLGAFLGFIINIFIFTSFLTAEEIGLTRVLLSASTLFASLAELGIKSSGIRFFPYFKSNDGKHNGFFFYILMLGIIGCIVTFPLFEILKKPVINNFQENSALFVDFYNWVIPMTIFIVFWEIFEVYSNVMMRIVVPRAIREVVVRLLMIAICLLYVFGVLSFKGFITSYVGIYGVAMLLVLFYISRISKITLKHDLSYVSKPIRKDFLQYTTYLIIGVLGGGIILYIDILMVSAKIGLDYAGIYSIAFYMAAIIEIPSRSISAIASPIAADALRAGDLKTANDLYKKVSLHQLMIGGIIFILLWINIDNIYSLIPNGEIYDAGKWVVFYIGLSRLVIVFLGFGYNLISFSKYYRWVLFFSAFVTIITILFNLWLIPIFGMTGAAIATLISYVVAYTLQQWLVFVKIKGNPYTLNSFKLICIILLLLGLNYLLPVVNNPWIDGIYRTIVIGGTGSFIIYFSKLSEQVNTLIENSFSFLFKRKK